HYFARQVVDRRFLEQRELLTLGNEGARRHGAELADLTREPRATLDAFQNVNVRLGHLPAKIFDLSAPIRHGTSKGTAGGIACHGLLSRKAVISGIGAEKTRIGERSERHRSSTCRSVIAAAASTNTSASSVEASHGACRTGDRRIRAMAA